jgi:hypothetical protein
MPTHPIQQQLVSLPCPECRLHNIGGGARIGNRRKYCTTCNNFAQNVMRLTRLRLKERHEDEYTAIRYEAELDLYPGVIDEFRRVSEPDFNPGTGVTEPGPAPDPWRVTPEEHAERWHNDPNYRAQWIGQHTPESAE